MYGKYTILLVAVTVIGVSHHSAGHGEAQEARAPASFTPGSRSAAENEGPGEFRREFHDLTRSLQVQQEQIDRQAIQLEQLQRELDGVRATASAATPATPASLSSMTTRLPDTCGQTCTDTCGDCAACERCGRRGCNGGCAWFEIGGQYRVMFNGSNFAYHAAPDGTLTRSQDPDTFFNQRFRTWLTIHPSENVEGYLQVEMGHIGWGQNFDFPKTYVGPRFPGADDRVGVELRRGWVGYQSGGLGRMRVGIQGWQDPFGQTLASSDWDFDVGGFSWLRTFPALGDMTMLLGAFSLDNGNEFPGAEAQLFALDLDWSASENNSFGFSVYYLPDGGEYSYPTRAPYEWAWDVWLGLRASTVLMQLPVNGFAIYNTGERQDLGAAPRFVHRGTLLKLGVGPLPLRCGALRFQALYSTGDSDPNDSRSTEFRTVAQSERDNFGSQGYWSYLVITSPHGPSDVNDLGVSVQNRGFGLFTVQGEYAYPISRRLSGAFAVGWLRSDTRNPRSNGQELGTELANTFTLDFGGGLKWDFGVAVLFTGDFYKTSPAAPRPDNLWEAFTRVQLEF